MGQGSDLMGTDRSDQPASPVTARTATVVVLSLGVGVVLGDAGVVILALPEILRDFGAQVWGVAWVLIAFNLVLALVAVPGRVCVCAGIRLWRPRVASLPSRQRRRCVPWHRRWAC